MKNYFLKSTPAPRIFLPSTAEYCYKFFTSLVFLIQNKAVIFIADGCPLTAVGFKWGHDGQG
jgi:hypothetical protein